MPAQALLERLHHATTPTRPPGRRACARTRCGAPGPTAPPGWAARRRPPRTVPPRWTDRGARRFAAPCTRRAAASCFAASRTASAPCFATKSAGSSPCGMIITTACTGIRLLERVRALGRSRAGLIRVEREDRALREPAEQAEVPLPQRRAACGHRVLDAGLHQPDHVGVALDHEDLAAARDRGARAGQVEQHLVLLVDRRLGGVQVLRLLARARVGRQDPGAEPDAAALQIVDRERDPPAEPVADRALVAARGQPRLQQDLGRELAASSA